MNELIFRIVTSTTLILIFYFSYIYTQIFYILLLLFVVISAIEYSQLIFKIHKLNTNRFFFILIAFIYLIFVIYTIIQNFDELKDIIFYFIIICISTDIGGLVAGKIFQGKKLTKISPKKTYAGFYGSFVASLVMMFVSLNYLNINMFVVVIFTLSVCLLSQLGDLFFSYLKRLAKVKDTGKLLPGHGGILDRVDGIIISVPINILFFTFST